jgi:tetratricopeptide (TPR) repeat protein
MVTSQIDKADLERHAKEAVGLALQGQWREAVAANRSILERFPDDVETCNRLGRALMEIGELAEARKTYERTLELDAFNSIAKKNLNRLSLMGKRAAKASPRKASARKADAHKVVADIFVEETGRARVVKLVSLAAKEVVAKMAPGEEVTPYVEGQRLLVKNKEGDCLGEVDPKYGARLAKLAKGGNRYIAAVHSLSDKEMKVIVREIYQHPSQAGRPSFPLKDKQGYRPYVRESLLRHRLEDEEFADEADEALEAEREGFSVTDVYDHSGSEDEGRS